MFSNKPKIDYASFDLNHFKYRNFEATGKFTMLLRKFAGTEAIIPPVIFPAEKALFYLKSRHLIILGEAIGFDEPMYTDLLLYHQDQLDQHFVIGFGIYMMIAAPALGTLLLLLIFMASTNSSLPYLSLLLVVALLFDIVVMGLLRRFSDFVIFRFFSVSLCIETLFYIIVELARCTNPLTPPQKKRLLLRTEFLIKVTRSLVNQYYLNDTTLDWAKNHFRNIESFIEEREKWIVAPKASTLVDLQQDFYNLALIYLSGNFGEFEYQTGMVPTEAPSNKLREFLIGLPRIAFGILIPILGLLVSSIRPDLVANIIDVKVFTLICVGWFLLALDSILKLGIVSSVIGIAKGIKDLA